MNAYIVAPAFSSISYIDAGGFESIVCSRNSRSVFSDLALPFAWNSITLAVDAAYFAHPRTASVVFLGLPNKRVEPEHHIVIYECFNIGLYCHNCLYPIGTMWAQ